MKHMCFLGILSAVAVSLAPCCSPAQAQASGFRLVISDNQGVPNNQVVYTITGDSLFITGLSDFGRTPVHYLARALSRQESRKLQRFFVTFPIDSLDDLYQDPFNPMAPENAGKTARIIEIDLHAGNRYHRYTSNNCWVGYSGRIFDAVNPLLPAETRIKYDKSSFNAFY